MSDLRQLLAGLTLEQRSQLELRLMQKNAARGTERIPRRSTFTPCPLSFAQQRLWFLDQLEPLSPFYNVPKALRLVGSLDISALQRTLDAIVARHEVLRTTYEAVDGHPMQMIGGDLPAEMAMIDLSSWSAAERDAETARLHKDAIHRPFDLARDVMLRANLLRLGAQEHLLLLAMHHIASDRWSTSILLRELSALYTAFSRGEPSPLPELPIQYADFAVWQREWLQGQVLETQLAYWKAHLEGAPPLLMLPANRPRPAVPSYRGGQVTFSLPKPLTTALKALSDRQGCTLFMTLLAAFKALLHRYTGQDRIVVGTPIANRRRVEVEGLIGFFVNTLVLHTDLGGNPSFRELLARVRQVALGAYAHQDLPFERLVEELQPERTLSHHPVFQAMFNYRSDPESTGTWPGLTVSLLPRENDSQPFDLVLAIADESEGLKGSLSYSSDLFDASTIQQLAGHYHTLLEGAAAHPDQPIATLPLLSASERQQLLVEWNATRRIYPQDVCLQQLFEAQVERSPEAVAVVFEGRRLTCRELNRHANQLAHHLKKLGVGPDLPVGLCVEPSPEMVVGILGILKAGGYYVPLDPTYPPERLAFMLEDAQPSVVLTTEVLLGNLPMHSGHVVCLDAHWDLILQECGDNPATEIRPDNVAYVIYTSGSTGTPKGVMGLHRNTLNRLHWMWQAYPFTGEEVCAQKTSLSFVDSIWELFGPLLQGVPLVLFPEEMVKDPSRLVHSLAAHQITRLVLVPSLLRMLLDSCKQGHAPLPALRLCISSGEALAAELVQRSRELLPACRLLNLYGASEVAADVTAYDTAVMDPAASHVPIGRPIANTQLYLLDRHLEPVPIGVPGELYIGGGLARGYLHRPELTAERFVPHPYSDAPGARLYKTGDLACYRPDGVIEFLGRLDHQVKIRGHRIELGEIEAVLGQHAGVQDAVVVAREDVPGDRRMVAYLVLHPQQASATQELRHFLQQRLPDSMVPAVFVCLDALPLTPNGKVDRHALPVPDPQAPTLGRTLVPPRTPVEEVLAGIWVEVLGLEQVGIDDNFFELGGHSLKAAQVMSRVHRALNVELPLRRFFETPTVAGLALEIAASQVQHDAHAHLASIVAGLEQLSDDEVKKQLTEGRQER
jgi:amino acid adenylation domain-containing protein